MCSRKYVHIKNRDFFHMFLGGKGTFFTHTHFCQTQMAQARQPADKTAHKMRAS